MFLFRAVQTEMRWLNIFMALSFNSNNLLCKNKQRISIYYKIRTSKIKGRIQGGGWGHAPTPSAKNLNFFLLWKVNFSWLYRQKFSIFRACSAYRHRRRIFSIKCYYFQAKSYEFSSKIPNFFSRAFGAWFCYYLSGIIIWYIITPPFKQQNLAWSNFFYFFPPSAFYFNKKFRASPPRQKFLVTGLNTAHCAYRTNVTSRCQMHWFCYPVNQPFLGWQ